MSVNLGIISPLPRPCVACSCIMCVLFQKRGSRWVHFKWLDSTPEDAGDAWVKLWTNCITYEHEIISRNEPRSGQTPKYWKKKRCTKSCTHFSTGTVGLLLAHEINFYLATWRTRNIPPASTTLSLTACV
jgi:hypothetical protein